MSEIPEGRPPGTGEQPPAPDTSPQSGADGAEAPPAEARGTETTPGPDPDESSADARGIHVPDALGEVEEQERVPEEESTIASPGEALEGLLPALEVTGHDGVDDALATLDDMAEKSVHEHVEVFDAVHEELRRTLDQAADQ